MKTERTTEEVTDGILIHIPRQVAHEQGLRGRLGGWGTWLEDLYLQPALAPLVLMQSVACGLGLSTRAVLDGAVSGAPASIRECGKVQRTVRIWSLGWMDGPGSATYVMVPCSANNSRTSSSVASKGRPFTNTVLCSSEPFDFLAVLTSAVFRSARFRGWQRSSTHHQWHRSRACASCQRLVPLHCRYQSRCCRSR